VPASALHPDGRAGSHVLCLHPPLQARLPCGLVFDRRRSHRGYHRRHRRLRRTQSSGAARRRWGTGGVEGWASRWWASRHRMPCASCQHSYNVCILGFLLNISLAIFVILTISYYPLRSGPCIHGAPTGPRHQRSSACVFLFKKTEATIPGTPSIRHFFRRVLILDFASMYLCRHDCKPMGALAVLPRIILIGRCGGHVGTSHDWSAYQP
jgi:hypothetical protein